MLRLSATVLRHALVSMDTGLDTRLVDTGSVVRLRVFPSRETVFPSVRIRVLTLVLTSTVNFAGAHLDTCRFAAYLSAYFTHYCFVVGQLEQWGSSPTSPVNTGFPALSIVPHLIMGTGAGGAITINVLGLPIIHLLTPSQILTW